MQHRHTVGQSHTPTSAFDTTKIVLPQSRKSTTRHPPKQALDEVAVLIELVRDLVVSLDTFREEFRRDHCASRPSRLLTLDEVADRTGKPHSSIYKLIDANDFPKQVATSKRSVHWHEHEIEAWIRSRPSK